MHTQLARPSVASLFLQAECGQQALSTATGFVVSRGETSWLITNWHVVSGRNPETGAPLSPTGGVPDHLRVMQNVAGQLGAWEPKIEALYGPNGAPLWLEHPTHGRRVDVVALPLTQTEQVELYPYQIDGELPDVAMGVARPLSIVGFPFGITGGGALGVWVQGTVATEPDLDYGDLPAFLIDSRTRSGQSGSPVIFFTAGGMVPMADGGVSLTSGGPTERLFGIYSGRINDQSDLGFVWRVDALREILDGGQPGSA